MPPQLYQPNKELPSYANQTYIGGVNLRESRLDIGDQYATELTNFDISINGKRRKRREPKTVATLNGSTTGFINGMSAFVDSTNKSWVVGALDGLLYKWDGFTGASTGDGHLTSYQAKLPGTSATYEINKTNHVRFARVFNNLYWVDGSQYLGRFNGTDAQAVTGTSPSLPIVPGTVVMSNGTVADDVTDDGAGNLLQYSNPVGTISYDTGIYNFTTAFPWSTGTVTAVFDTAVAQPEETFSHAASDGTLQFPSLLHAPIKPASLSLTDGFVTLHTTEDLYSDQATYPGWMQIRDAVDAEVGAYDATTAKFFVSVASTFTAARSITAIYTYATATATDSLDYIRSDDGSGGYYWFTPGNTTTHASIVAGSLSATTAIDGNWHDVSDTLYNAANEQRSDAIDRATGTLPLYGYNSGNGQVAFYPVLSYDYWTTPIAIPESVGTSDASGKLEGFRLSQTAIALQAVKIYEGSNIVTGIPNASASLSALNLAKGTTDAGFINSTTGIFAINLAGAFTAYSSPAVLYYMPSTVSPQSITFGALSGAIGGLIPFGGQDIIWWNNRLWITGDNSLSFSDAYAPESFSQPSLAVSATGKLKLLGYSYNRLYLFNCEAGSLGEVFYVDVTDATPANWKATSLYAGINFLSTDCIIRAATNDSADIFYWTSEGWRTLKTTVQDHVSGPGLPFDFNIKPWMDDLNKDALEKSWAIVFDDEMFAWHCKSATTTPNVIHAYNMKIQRQTPQDGWTKIDMVSSSGVRGIEAFCGCIADFGSGMQLYIGSATGGEFVQMFGADTTADNFTARAVSKGTSFDDRFSNTSPFKVLERFGENSVGTLTVKLKDDQDTEWALGTLTLETSGTKNLVRALDATVAYGGSFGSELPSSTDWRVIEETNNDLELCGFRLIHIPSKLRFMQEEEANTNTIVQGSISVESVLQGAI